MKKIQVLLILFMCINLSFAQLRNPSNNMAKEKIYAHLNTSFLVPGETLYYSIYCLNDQTNKLSKLSKIAYIEILDENKESIFKQKIKLTDGIGYSDFFVPSSFPSGNYKLIAYTTLMRNTNSFFTNNLLIVNPFHEDQSNIIDTTSVIAMHEKVIQQSNTDSQQLSLKTGKNNFTTREKITIIISALLQRASYGDYSISVKKKYAIASPQIMTSTNFQNFSEQGKLDSSQFFMPEFRGELISGKVINKNTNTPLSNLKVALSIPEKEPLFKISSTNEEGIFYFSIQEDYENTLGFLQIIDNNSDGIEILLPKNKLINYNQFLFDKKYTINEKQKEILLSKSINSQIENSYKIVKQDSIKENNSKSLFFGTTAKDYYLDDYKRFPTLKETFVEVIENAWVAKKGDKNFLKIKRNLDAIDFDLPTLVLVDGILIQEHDEIISMDPKEISKISVIRDQYIYGPHIFEGVIAIETLEGNFKSVRKHKKIELFKPTQRKNYFSPRYTEDGEYNRIPDLRDQLLWLPYFKVNSEQQTVDFYTSDEKGIYEINLEGFTSSGIPVSIKKTITVK